jgi:hypothetical protein
MFSVALRLPVLALRVHRPIQREPVAHRPFRKVNAINRTYRNRAPVLIQAHGRATDRPSRNEGVKLIRCLCAALVLQALIVATKLAAFRSVDSPQANPRPVNL